MKNKINSVAKQTKQRPANGYNVSVIDKRLAFKTIADYERIVNQPTQASKIKFLQTIKSLKGFTSFAQKQNPSINLKTKTNKLKNLINDDFFTHILNSDLAVQIGTNIFKVNLIKEKVYVLPVTYADQYKDLINENTRNKNIQIFSTGDDVLDIIKKNGKKSLLCTQSGIGGRDRTTGVIYVDNGGTIRMEGEIHFNRYGIYFSLFAEVETRASGIIEMTIDLEPIYYHVRCGSTRGPENLYGSGSGSKSNYKKYQSYQGSKNLNEVFFRARFHATYTYPTAPPPLKNPPSFTKDSSWIEIRVNY